jgi:hypothetical protein
MPFVTLNFCIALQGVFPQRPYPRSPWSFRMVILELLSFCAAVLR